MNRVFTCALLVGILVAVSAAAFARVPPQEAIADILISRQLLESRRLEVGDVVRLSPDRSADRARPFRIAGVYEPTPDPLRFAQPRLEVRLHLPDLLALKADPSDPASAESVTSINVALRNPSDASAFARDVATSTFVVVERFHLAIAIVTVIGSAVFLLALMVMLVDERRGTVGTLRLIGFTRRRILIQVLIEGALIALAGAVFGILFALASEGAFNRFFQWRYDTTLVFLRVTPQVVWQSLAMSVPLGMAASLIASWTMVRQPLLTLVRR